MTDPRPTWNERADEAMRQWHATHGTIDPGYQHAPPLTLRERVTMYRLNRLAKDLGLCPTATPPQTSWPRSSDHFPPRPPER